MIIVLALSMLLSSLGASQANRSEAERWFTQARQYFDKQDWEQSRSAAMQALKADPQLADAEVLLGLIASLQSHLAEAEQHLRRAVDLQPSNPQAHAYLAGVHLQQKRLTEAETGYRQVLKLNPGNSAALYNLGLIALLRNQPAQALPHFQQLRHQNPRDVPALMGLLETQLLLKQKTAARESAKQIERLLDPTDPRLFQAATLLALHQEYASAIPILERLKATAPESFQVHYNLALACFRARQYDRAAQVLRSLSDLDQLAEALNLLGQVEEQRNRPQEALEAFNRAAGLEPRNEQFRFDYAHQLFQQGRIEKAAQAFHQGRLDFPQSWKMRVGLGASQYLSGQAEKAAQSLLEAVKIAPETSLAFFLLGKLYELAPGSQAAIREAFQRYLEKPKRDAWAYLHYGTILFLEAQSQPQPDFKDAIRQLHRALELSPQFPEASLQLGIIVQAQGKFVESARLLEQALASAPNLASAHYRLAQVYQRLGLKEKAQAEFEAYEKLRAAKADPDDELRSRLQTLAQRP